MSLRRAILTVFVVALTISALGVIVAGGSPHTGMSALTTGTSPAAPAAHSTHSTLSDSSGTARVQQVMNAAKSDHLPLEAVSLPNLLGQSRVSNGIVEPISTVAPAPMGLGAYGIHNTSGTPSAFSYTSQSWEGSITLNSVNTFLLANDGAISSNGSMNTFGVQLNAVTNGTTVGTTSTYSFWTQNVLYFNFPVPGYVTFLDNVWNFSSPATSLTAGTLYSYNGTPVYPEFYYDFGPSFPITFPVTVQLYLNSSVTNLVSTGMGYSTVKFGYNIINAATGASQASGVYDTVLFNSSTPAGSVPAAPYLVDGSQVNPTGFIPWDAEIMIGGPGGGTTTSVYGISGSESLMFLNATTGTYQMPPSAWNIGSETGETSEGVAETYTTAGTVMLGAGPSIPAPLWGATPGGNIGQGTLSGTLSPTNAFLFFTPGSSFDANYASWAPTQTASSVDYVLPPGTYTVSAMMSDYTPMDATVTLTAGVVTTIPLTMTENMAEGVYAPLFAWNNAQLAAISTGGAGTLASPYLIMNNPSPMGLNPVFGQFNDYLYQVFPGVLIVDTTAYVSMNHPSTLGLTYQSGYDSVLDYFGLPYTNNLQFELFNTSHVTIWGAQGITGWFFYDDYGPSGLLPLANVVVWGGYQNLIGDNTFMSQGSGLLLAGVDPSALTDNVVWGNIFENSTMLTPTMYPGDGATNGPPVGIWAYEGGDLIYNNFFDTTITAYSPPVNMFFGTLQPNAENWNLSRPESAFLINMFNGYALTGSIVGTFWQGGNYWGSPGLIATGGDYYPYPPLDILFVVQGPGLGEAWSVTINGQTITTDGFMLFFYVTPGTYTYTASVLPGGGSISPSTGTVTVATYNALVVLTLT